MLIAYSNDEWRKGKLSTDTVERFEQWKAAVRWIARATKGEARIIAIETCDIVDSKGLYPPFPKEIESIKLDHAYLDKLEAERKPYKELNDAQKIAARAYGGGDYAYIADDKFLADEWKPMLDKIGDGLFRFIMTELDDKEDCENLSEAARRMETAGRDIADVLTAIENVEIAPNP